MKRLSQLSLFALSTYITVVLFLSILLTNEKFYMYILNTYIEPQSTLEIRNIHWHPINPSLEISDLRIGEGGKIIDANEVTLSFSLPNLFTGKLISSLNIFKQRREINSLKMNKM